jgi:cytochrome P450
MQALARGDTVDIARTARALSGRLTLTLMGVEPSGTDHDDADALDVHALGERIASALQLSRLPARQLRRVQQDLDRLLAYANRAFASPSVPPSSLVGRLRSMGCDREETRGILSIFFVAGALTLAVALPRLVALLVDSGQLALVHADATLAARAVDEGLRYTCPVPLTLRLAAHDHVLGGVRVRAGERVVILTSNLARDPQLFADPARFDITRRHDPRARYLWYGAGPHFCLGFTLAQRALQEAIGLLASPSATLRIVRRTASRGVLLPAWKTLLVARA